MEKITRKAVWKNKSMTPYCSHAKLMAVLRLSNEEYRSLMERRQKRDIAGIRKLFTDEEAHKISSMSPNDFEVIEDPANVIYNGQEPEEGILLMLASHAFCDSKVLAVVLGRHVFEFVPGFRYRRFFTGACGRIVYAVCGPLWRQKAKPVNIHII